MHIADMPVKDSSLQPQYGIAGSGELPMERFVLSGHLQNLLQRDSHGGDSYIKENLSYPSSFIPGPCVWSFSGGAP